MEIEVKKTDNFSLKFRKNNVRSNILYDIIENNDLFAKMTRSA